MSMRSRKPISMEEHRKMGISIKKAEHAILDVLKNSSYFYARETDKMVRALSNLGLLKSRLESEMFREHPYLPNEVGFAVYYGDLEEEGGEIGCDDSTSL